MPIIEVRNVSRQFVAVQALVDIDLSINQGEIHALVGENGAGKSTLGKIISGIERPDTGTLHVRGETRNYTHPIDALRDGITTITQEIALMNKQTIIDNVLLGREIQRYGILNRAEMRAEFERILQSSGFNLNPDAIVGSLHLADKKKVEVLRAIARDSELIIMDEPTAMLADDETQLFLEIVRDLNKRGHTIIYISHFLEEVLNLADTVTIMRNGRIVRTAPTSEETTNTLVEAMLGQTLSEMYPPRVLPSADAPNALEVRGLQSNVFEGIDLNVRSGEIVGLAGLVGSGRSRLMRHHLRRGRDPRWRDTHQWHARSHPTHFRRHPRGCFHAAREPQRTRPFPQTRDPQQFDLAPLRVGQLESRHSQSSGRDAPHPFFTI